MKRIFSDIIKKRFIKESGLRDWIDKGVNFYNDARIGWDLGSKYHTMPPMWKGKQTNMITRHLKDENGNTLLDKDDNPIDNPNYNPLVEKWLGQDYLGSRKGYIFRQLPHVKDHIIKKLKKLNQKPTKKLDDNQSFDSMVYNALHTENPHLLEQCRLNGLIETIGHAQNQPMPAQNKPMPQANQTSQVNPVSTNQSTLNKSTPPKT